MKTKTPVDEPSAGQKAPDEETRPWQTVASFARQALEREVPESEAAPFGFSTRVVAQWMAQRRGQAAMLWQRWSFRAAIFSVALALFAVLAGRPARSGGTDGGTILPFPGLEVPLPTETPDPS